MPARGPMRETLTLLMDSVSNSGSLAFCSSMAAVMPKMSVERCGVVLKNSRWRCMASVCSSLVG